MTRSTLSSVLRLALLAAPAVALAACSTTPMPTGYTYHNEIYKSPPGPEAPKPAVILQTGQDAMNGGMNKDGVAYGMKNGDVYTASANMDANGHWDRAADDLVAMILRDLGRPMEKVFVPGADDFVTAMKGSLARHDIPVAMNPGDGPFVIEHEIAGPTATIHFFSNHDKILSESGHYPEAKAAVTDMSPVTSVAPAKVTTTTVTKTSTTTIRNSGLNN